MIRGSVRDQITVDGVPVDLVDPALCTPTPNRMDALRDPDSAAAAATIVDPSGEVMRAVESLHPDRLGETGLIDAIVACDRLKAALDATQAELLTEIADRDPNGAEFLQDEIGCALRLAPGTAAERVETARALTGRLWDTFELLRAGHLSHVHARILGNATQSLSDEVTRKVQERVLRRAPGQTPGEFRASVRRAVAFYERRDEAKRHREAVTERRVVREPVEDGMSWIRMFLPDDGAAIFMTALNAWATKTDPDDERTADQRRADAAVELALAGLAMPGVPSSHGLRPTVNVTLAASTLAGADDQPGYVNGQPVPADLARRYAGNPGATYRYWAVDSFGHIQDTSCGEHPATRRTEAKVSYAAGTSGLRSDAYAPPPSLVRHVTFRDQHCVMPGCRRRARTCELDHRTPWPEGDTSAENLEPLCKRHHDLKHHSRWRIQKNTDGSYDWTSPTRHRYRYRPPEYPIAESPAPGEPVDDLPPPF